MTRLLLVASPMVSRGGVYTYISSVTAHLRAAGHEPAVLWGMRGGDADFSDTIWSRRIADDGPLPRRLLGQRAAIVGAVRHLDPDVVLSHLPQSDLACALTPPEVRRRWVAMVHGQPFPSAGEQASLRRRGWRAAMRTTYPRARGVVTISHGMASMLERDLRVRRAVVVHNGIDLPGTAESTVRHRPVLGFVGRLATEKAPEVFLAAAALLDAPARVYGTGPLEPVVRQAASELPNVEVCGWVSREEAFSAIDVLMLTSHREALSLAILEAGARGRSVVARGIGGVPEIFDDDPELRAWCLTGHDATPQDFAALARPMLENRGLREEAGRRLQAIVRERFDGPTQAAALADACARLVA